MDLNHCKEILNLFLTFGENHMTEKQKTWAYSSAENFKKTCELDELAPAPAIRSCDYGLRILYFYSFQMSNI